MAGKLFKVAGKLFKKEIKRMERKRRAKVKQGLTRLAFKIGGEAQRLAPVFEGYLRASMAVNINQTAKELIARIYFLVPYAAYQHEGVNFQHPKGGEAKYLEKSLNANKENAFKLAGNLKGT